MAAKHYAAGGYLTHRNGKLMRSRPLSANGPVRLIVAALAVSVAPAVAVPSASAAPESSVRALTVLQCAFSVPIYTVNSNGDLWLREHLEPEAGLDSWGTSRQIGAGFLSAGNFAGPDGVIYSAMNNGELRRRRWNGNTWDTFAGGAQYEVLGTDPIWARYADYRYDEEITADAQGHIYTIEPDGNLHWRSYNSTTGTWTHRVVDGGWGGFDQIVASGSGTIYAIGSKPSTGPPLPPGHIRPKEWNLYRFQYHAASQRIVQDFTHAGFSTIVANQVPDLLSPGGDILYEVIDSGSWTTPDASLNWHRYDNNTGDSSSHVIQPGGWHGFSKFSAPDACQQVGETSPIRPQVALQPHAPVSLMHSSNGHVHYSYADPEGRAAYADVDLAGGPAGVAVVPGFTGVTGITSTGENQDGRIQIVGQGRDAEIRGNIKTSPSGPQWTGTTTLGGFVVSPAIFSRLPDSTLVTYAVDNESGSVWFRKQIGANGPLAAWRESYATAPLFDNGPLSVIPIAVEGYAARMVGQDRSGDVWTTVIRPDGSLTAWTSLGGGSLGFRPIISVVDMPDNTPQVFATGRDGVVYTKRRTSAGWDGTTWTAVPGVAAAGRPSAVMAPDGTLQIVVSATDGYVYYTGQLAPGSPAFKPWREITNYDEQASTDPTALAVPESNTWVVAYLNDLEVPRLRRYQPAVPGPAAAASAGPEFVIVPITPPAP